MPDSQGYEDMNTALTAAPVAETVETPEIPAPPETPVEVESTPEEVENAALAAEETPETPEAAPEADDHKQRNKAAEKRIADLIKQRSRLEGQVAALSQQRVIPPPPMADPMAPPDPKLYTDEIDYKVDLKMWERDQKTKDEAFKAKQADAIVKHPDLPELIEADAARNAQGIPTANPTMVNLIKGSDIAGDLWHHLLAHPEMATRIARMDPINTALEIGMIKAQLTAPPPPKPAEPKKAPLPPPLAPVKTGKSGGPPKSEFVEY